MKTKTKTKTIVILQSYYNTNFGDGTKKRLLGNALLRALIKYQ